MENTLKELLWKQFGAALDMLENAITMCPDHVWFDKANWPEGETEQKTLETYKPEFWYIAYHLIFWTDYYLTGKGEDSFRPPAPFGMEEFDERGLIPPRVYSKEELLTYLEFCREKSRALVNSQTLDTLFADSNMTYREDYSVMEIFLYNMRHVQHHTAQLNLLLRQRIDDAPRWVGRTKRTLDE